MLPIAVTFLPCLPRFLFRFLRCFWFVSSFLLTSLRSSGPDVLPPGALDLELRPVHAVVDRAPVRAHYRGVVVAVVRIGTAGRTRCCCRRHSLACGLPRSKRPDPMRPRPRIQGEGPRRRPSALACSLPACTLTADLEPSAPSTTSPETRPSKGRPANLRTIASTRSRRPARKYSRSRSRFDLDVAIPG